MSKSTENKTPVQETAQPARPGFFRRMGRGLSWLLLTLLKVIAVVGFIALLGAGGWFGYQEYEKITGSADKTNDRVATLEAQLESSIEDNADLRAELDLIATEMAMRGGEIGTINDALDEGVVVMDHMEATIEADITRIAVSAASQEELLDNLVQGLGDLQGDFTANRGDLDTLGGEIDTLGGQIETLDSELTQLDNGLDTLDETLASYDTPERELARIQQVLYLFRTWEMIGRSRLRIAEGNAGLAVNDVEMAQAALEGVLASSADVVVDELLEVRQRLILAQESLPADPVSAERDLETAWEALDTLITMLIGDVTIIVPPPSVESTPVVTGTVSAETVPTPTVTATPESDE